MNAASALFPGAVPTGSRRSYFERSEPAKYSRESIESKAPRLSKPDRVSRGAARRRAASAPACVVQHHRCGTRDHDIARRPSRASGGRKGPAAGGSASSSADIAISTPPRVDRTQALPHVPAAWPQWRNGRRDRLKICCPQGRAGSSPAWGTKTFSKFSSIGALRI